MNWPGSGNDPFYVRNPSENTARRNYYGITGVPNLKCDGVLGNSGSAYQSYYNSRRNLPSPVDINLNITAGNQIDITAEITADSVFSGANLKLHLALIAIAYDIGGGGWTYTHFEWGMLDMVPSASGQTFSITPNQTVTLNASCPIPTITTLDNMAIVAFVQNDVSREVLNAKYGPIPLDFPSLSLVDYAILDPAPGGNGNGFPEPGESCSFWAEFENGQIFAPATGISATMQNTDPYITISTGQAVFPDIGSGARGDNRNNPYEFQVDQAHPGGVTTFNIDLTANAGAYTNQYQIPVTIGVVDYLIVDDDGGETRETRFAADLDSLGIVYEIWENETGGVPSGQRLSAYRNVIWFTGSELDPIAPEEQTSIAAYLDGGGHLFITSENMNDAIGGTPFFNNYMRATSQHNYVNASFLTGVAGDPISDNTQLVTYGDVYYPTSPSSIVPDASADAIYTYDNTQNFVGALRYQGDYWLVYFALPFEAVSNINPSYTPRRQVLQNIVDWFATDRRPQIAFSTDSLLFPETTAGESDSLELTIYNRGDADLVLLWMSTGLSNIYTTTWNPVHNTIVPGDSLLIDVIFSPADTIQYVDSLTVLYEETYAVVYLEGRGVPVSGVSDNPQIAPNEYTLSGPYPNPFNPTATIEISLPMRGWIEAMVYNTLGEKAAEVYTGELNAGFHRFTIDGNGLASGLYFLKVTSAQGILIRKMILMK